jgi:hypothetical protein
MHRNNVPFYVPVIKERHQQDSLFKTRVYADLVALGWDAADELKI